MNHTPVTPETTPVRVHDLRTPYPSGLLGVPSSAVTISWAVTAVEPGLSQLAYEVQAAADLGFTTEVRSSGEVVSSESTEVEVPGGALASREQRHIRVRIRTERGWTAWSEVASIEAGLTQPADWLAHAIGIPSAVEGPAPLLRTEFTVREAPVRARLYVTSLGIHEVEINGARVGDAHFAPGWTSYGDRLLVATHDVTAAITTGSNALGATLSDGWYRGVLGWEGHHSHYGSDLALLAQLELTFADGSTMVVVSDDSWTGSFGAVRASGLYLGCDTDLGAHPDGWSLPGFDDSAWEPVRRVALDARILEPHSSAPVRTVAEFPMTQLRQSPGLVFDGGQNLAGWVRIRVRGRAGDTVEVRHAEVLEPDGRLHTRSLRSARATDTYVLDRDGDHTLEPRFTFHGFRYASVESNAEVLELTAVAVSSDTSPRSRFTCAEPMLERLHSNVVWSQRSNFVSIPTDCPQRDERLGWTGDAQAFAPTANTLFDSAAFWASWLRDLEIDQAADGGVAAVVPNVLAPHSFLLDGVGQDVVGRAGWADAASIVPWSVYESYGDTRVVRQQLGSMRRWVTYLDDRRGADGLLPSAFQFGDWLDPDAPGDQPWQAKADSRFVANAFFARVARIQQWAEDRVGDAELARHYGALADDVAAATWATWRDHALTTQTGCALAIEFDLAPPAERDGIGEALAAHVHESGGRISTGFLGTPLVLHALTSTGQVDAAYQMLLCRDAPSWLYQVEMGATTVWERWDALDRDGSIHSGEMANGDDAQMLSFNHYAYGAVVDWIYRTLAGISPDVSGAGYRRFRVAPRPTRSISSASASVSSSRGDITIAWVIESSGELSIDLTVPFGATAILDLPLSEESVASAHGELGYGRHRVTVTRPSIADV